ncbi:MAG: tol-pal system protein YbgF [Gammaproteobacteria bacterium]|nr:tol-pal system protein YbgF [Gammaproteobacteria bacterium]
MNSKASLSIRLVIIGGLLLAGSQAWAQTKNNQQLTNDVNAMQQSLDSIQQDMQQLRRLLENRAMLELFQRMDELADEVSGLRGMLEEQTNDLAGLKKRQRELYLDIDRRLRELEITAGAAAAAAPAAPTPAPPAPAVSTPPPAAVLPAVPAVAPPAVPAASPQVAKPATISKPSKPGVTVSEERAAYQKAFDMLKEGRYKMANASFKEFLGRFPQSSYAGNAQYWLGESNYVSRQFEQAIREFQAVLDNYPGSNKVPDAMLKLGYTHYELRQFDAAKSTLNELRNNYPNTSASRLASKRLERMSREGL